MGETALEVNANPGYTLKLAWDRKMRSAFEACRAQRVSFIPNTVETIGGWDPEVGLIRKLPQSISFKGLSLA